MQPQEAQESPETLPPAPEGQAPSDSPSPSSQEEAPEGQESPAEEKEAAPEEGEETPPAKPEEKHRRQSGYQRKIERLERALEERDALLGKFLSQQQPPAPTDAPPPNETPAQKAAREFEALIESTVAKRLQAAQQQQQAEATQVQFQQRVAEARTTHPDWDEVVSSVSHVRVPQYVQDALLTSENGPEIMYRLAENEAELARISALPPVAAVREIGRFEAKLASGAAPKAAPKATPKKPAAPAPIAPVSTRGPSAVKRPDDMTYEEYSAWRSSQRKR